MDVDAKAQAEQEKVASRVVGDLPKEDDLTDVEKKRMKEVQEGANHYSADDWDDIRARSDVGLSMIGNTEISGEDWAAKMVEIVNERKRYYEQKRYKAHQSKPMTCVEQRKYMLRYLKHQCNWTLTQLKGHKFEFINDKFEGLVKSRSHFVPPSDRTVTLLKRLGLDFDFTPSKILKDV